MESDPMAKVPAVAIVPPARCFATVKKPDRGTCGNWASMMRPGKNWFEHQFFCGEHARAGDVPIPQSRAFRRVRISVDVYMCGTNINAPLAHAEALGRLELVTQVAGAVLDVHDVRSDWVKTTPGPGPQDQTA